MKKIAEYLHDLYTTASFEKHCWLDIHDTFVGLEKMKIRGRYSPELPDSLFDALDLRLITSCVINEFNALHLVTHEKSEQNYLIHFLYNTPNNFIFSSKTDMSKDDFFLLEPFLLNPVRGLEVFIRLSQDLLKTEEETKG
jgi:hypothetical protein